MPARYKYIFVVLHCLVFLFLFSSPIYSSQVVINEFLADLPTGVDERVEEWVELYNKGSVSVNLNGWVIRDAIDSHMLVIEGVSIDPKGFVVIKRNNASLSLNNSSDDVRLYTSTSSASPIDSFSYSKTHTNKSWGRIPDGIGDFAGELIPSPGTHNLAPTPEPTPTPTNSSTPTPSSSPSTPENESDNDESEDEKGQISSDEKGVVAGYKTTVASPASTHSGDLEILPISPATFSAIEVIDEDPFATESGKSGRWVNTPIILGSTLTASGIVAYLLKRYNIISRIRKRLWKKTKS